MIPQVGAEELKAIFAANLNRLMGKRGKRVSDLAADLNLPYMTVSSWAKGKNIPRMDKIEALANYFRVSKAELIEEHKEKPTLSGEQISEMEHLIQLYDSAPDELKAAALAVLKSGERQAKAGGPHLKEK